MCLVGIITVVISQFNNMYYYFDDQNFYHRSDFFMVSQFFGIVGEAINGWMLIKHRNVLGKKMFRCFLTYIAFPVIAMGIQLFLYGIALLNIAMTMSLMLMFVFLQVERGRKLKEQAEMIIERERLLNDMRIKIALSQIQPHFLYNALNTIYYMCEKSPQDAQKAISDFSEYLRVNLDSLKRSTPVHFEVELKHTETYLALEKMRFDDILNVEYDIKTINFKVPPLSVQPLVENAVKYGIAKSAEGGTVTISTVELEDRYEIVVSDDGVGYDPVQIQDDGRSHIGIDSVRQRLEDMCHATLDITSTKGKGTRAVIRIPKMQY